ncbi:Isoprenylcysteine carboxyl methyltransferase [Pirellula staleyi DSM 6068]|uniref:Isoprenylcysteine carboxyl methyltransferase n=1 Tax=Pirellula staleyi (strain ATCC 27377 / DSM 6068 / ICPB 4128) TaxID=530564 RepID=D2QWY5_PIRSD|nr:isoprenylcysteine carboxylmethyltransferase family protein [Pirellula staleyi]ADB16089.1 Isoprenylcysteine carboxyl methyltransferase [Pirellula staleyi DSM 6068]
MSTEQSLVMARSAPASSKLPDTAHSQILRETTAPPSLGESFDLFVTRRRIAISLLLFSTILAIDVLLLDVRPRNLLNFTDIGTICGWVGVILGLALRSWSAGTLHKNAVLTQIGPYSITRNPLYVGSFLMMLGFCSLVHDMHTIWIVAGPMAWIYWVQVKQEERLLSHLYPHDWNSYAAATPRFIPRPWNPVRGGSWSLAQWARNREYKAIVASAIGLVGLWAWHVFTW